jgi:uncharacterized protein (DUF736 family)
MKIGDFIPSKEGDHFDGKVVTRTMRFPRLIMRRVTQVLSGRSAVFEIFEFNQYNEEVQVGAVWERSRRSNGELLLIGLIDDPSFSDGLPFALFGDERDGYVINWRREREQFEADNYRSGNSQPARGGGFGGGFGQRRGAFGGQRGFSGGSTAGPNGQYVPSGDDLDEQPPF